MQLLLISSLCILLMAFSKTVGASQNVCTESKCGDESDNHDLAIHFPFSRGHHCRRYSGFQCDWRHETVHEQQLVLIKFFVKHINYKSQEIQVYNPHTCLLIKPVEIPNLPISPFYLPTFETKYTRVGNVTLFQCSTPLQTDINAYQVPCLGDPGNRIYAVTSSYPLVSFLTYLPSCTKMYDVLSLPYGEYVGKDTNILRFKWSQPNCRECEAKGKRCRLKTNGIKSEVECVHLRKASKTREFVAIGATLGSLVLSLLVIALCRAYSSHRKETQNRLKIERFLEDYRALKPSRYSYADIKRITNQFKENLGQGAYGTVFKGKLSSDCFVAVKVLNNSKTNGEEFVNEVGMMGRIHHVNVVRLAGFCAEGFERALVYEYFPNGSLQDFITSADSKNSFLGWEKLQDIAIGIAKGIEHLHQGCDQRILHFDIKPHNVLLDNNFYLPKSQRREKKNWKEQKKKWIEVFGTGQPG